MIGAAGAAAACVAASPRGRRADLSYATFLDRATESLRQLLPAAGRAEQDAYVYAAAAQLRRLAGPPELAFNDKYKLDIKPTDKTRCSR